MGGWIGTVRSIRETTFQRSGIMLYTPSPTLRKEGSSVAPFVLLLTQTAYKPATTNRLSGPLFKARVIATAHQSLLRSQKGVKSNRRRKGRKPLKIESDYNMHIPFTHTQRITYQNSCTHGSRHSKQAMRSPSGSCSTRVNFRLDR